MVAAGYCVDGSVGGDVFPPVVVAMYSQGAGRFNVGGHCCRLFVHSGYDVANEYVAGRAFCTLQRIVEERLEVACLIVYFGSDRRGHSQFLSSVCVFLHVLHLLAFALARGGFQRVENIAVVHVIQHWCQYERIGTFPLKKHVVVICVRVFGCFRCHY